MSSIPIHRLQDKTALGFELKAFSSQDNGSKKSDDVVAHRDDHYIFFLITEGTGSALVDFEAKTIRANQLYYILPEQIHYRINTTQARGWFIAADPSLIEPACRQAFEHWSGFQEPVNLAPNAVQDCDQLLAILHGKMTRQPPESVGLAVLHSLLRSFFAMAADTIRVAGDAEANQSRSAELARQFKKLLREHIRTHKSPSDYARMLHVSEPYLNESVKKLTGSSVSFWIKYKHITEAKRLLYFSDLTVKQIAGELGFDNHSYFSRLFGQETGMTALTFRKKFKGPTCLR